jgi:threonine dehydrogenase-like Zn-dependent dehydrogenase
VKALVHWGNHTVAWVDVPEPDCEPGDEIVDVLVAGVCGTDLGAVRSGRPPIPTGMVLGHEFVGRKRSDGTLVVGNPILSCAACRACREGRPHLCERREVLGVHRPGAFAESVAVPAANLRQVNQLDLTRAAMVEPIATALHAWRLSPMPAGSVAVLGAGPIGMSLLHVLKTLGIRDVTVTDIAPERLAFARACGADIVTDRASSIYDVVLDTVGATETRRDAIEHVRAGGTAILVGLHAPDLSVAGGLVVAAEKTIRGSFAYTPREFEEAIDLAATLDTRWVANVPFTESADAFSHLLAGTAAPASVKVHFHIAD